MTVQPQNNPQSQPTSPAAPRATAFRIGHGYDLHRLEPVDPAPAATPSPGPGNPVANHPKTQDPGPKTSCARPFILGGVRIPSPVGPVGHSDGDALYHAVTDALLGALALPDIGQLFPDTDPRHDNEDSSVYVKAAGERVAAAGWRIENLDCTIIAERPKISPVKDQMRANIARHLNLDISQVNVKGKTHEKVDAVGEGRAIEVHVVALLTK